MSRLPTEPQIKLCYKTFVDLNIWSEEEDVLLKNWKLYALRNHPDKGGDAEIFKLVSSCRDIIKKDFEYFKRIAKKPEQPKQEEQKREQEQRRQRKQQEQQRRQEQEQKEEEQKQAFTYERFLQKECTGERGGWLVAELRQFCDILGLDNSGTKLILCKRINDHFKNANNDSENNKETIRKQQAQIQEQLQEIRRLDEKIQQLYETTQENRKQNNALENEMKTLNAALDNITREIQNQELLLTERKNELQDIHSEIRKFNEVLNKQHRVMKLNIRYMKQDEQLMKKTFHIGHREHILKMRDIYTVPESMEED